MAGEKALPLKGWSELGNICFHILKIICIHGRPYFPLLQDNLKKKGFKRLEDLGVRGSIGAVPSQRGRGTIQRLWLSWALTSYTQHVLKHKARTSTEDFSRWNCIMLDAGLIPVPWVR